jgi:hypothetical protein
MLASTLNLSIAMQYLLGTNHSDIDDSYAHAHKGRIYAARESEIKARASAFCAVGEAYRRLRSDSAPGVDGQTVEMSCADSKQHPL